MEPGELIVQRFQIERRAGAGGMGEVYRALDRTTGEPVALKVLIGLTDSGERMAREAQALAELRHPGIVRYVAHGTMPPGIPWLAMEWLEGEDLSQLLQRGSLGIAESVELVRRAADALAVAHARGFIHRDLKPSNVFLPGGDLERPKLLDFGLARHGTSRAVTRTNMVLGTPGYMAPEQARGERTVDARADVFSLGCVLFECLTGRPAFVGEHVMAVLAKVLLEEAPRARDLRRDVPRDLDALLGRMLAKAPADRPADGAAVAAELEALAMLPPASEITMSGRTAGSALTRGEQRLQSVVLAASRAEEPESGAVAPTLVTDRSHTDMVRLRNVVKAFAGRLEPLADGSLVAILSTQGAATDQAAKAARCALAMRRLLPGVSMALATGRGQIEDRGPVGEAIDRAAKLLRAARDVEASAIRVDDVTAGLLDARFDVSGDAQGLVLSGEREAVDATRTLLGKPTPCVGRERELSVLQGALDECVDEPAARAVLLTAPAGYGKSRVRYEFLQRIRDRPMEIWIGRGDAMRAGSPFGTLAPAIRRAAGVFDGEPLALRRWKLRARLSRHLSGKDLERVTEFIGELIGTSFARGTNQDSVQLRAARQDPMLMGDQMRRAWEDWIVAETSAQPVLLVLEDLHWGDLPSIKFVDAALRIAREQPFMVLALARPEVHETFPRLWADRGLLELGLGELPKRSSEKLVRSILGAEADAGEVQRLVERAAGNAFYLEELIRAVAEGKGSALPETVLAMVSARLEALDPEARRVLRAASVFGDIFWRGGLEVLLGGEVQAAPLDEWLSDLCSREVIARLGAPKFPGDQELTFRHALLREAAYATLTEEDRVLGHRLAGEWLERAGERDAMVLAEHFERGALPERAVAWYQRAAEHALEGNDFAAAVARAERGVACGAEGEARGFLRMLQAEAHDWHGRPADGFRAASEAVNLLPRESSGWYRAVAELATSGARLGRIADVAPHARILTELPLDPHASGPPVVTRARTALQLSFAGSFELANRLFAQLDALDADALRSDPAVAARVHQAYALRAHLAGDVAEQLRLNEASAEGFLRAGDVRAACGARVNAGFGYVEVGAYADAERSLRAALESAERMGLMSVAAAARQNLGACLLHVGKLPEARAVTDAAIVTFGAQGVVRMEGGARIYLAQIHHLAGNLDAAAQEARKAAELLSVAPPIRPCALATLGRVLVDQGKVGEALSVAREAVESVAAAHGVEEGETLVYLLHAEALYAAGDVEGARSAIAAARDNLLARAARIGSPQFRESFLTNVPENARTLKLASEWLRPTG